MDSFLWQLFQQWEDIQDTQGPKSSVSQTFLITKNRKCLGPYDTAARLSLSIKHHRFSLFKTYVRRDYIIQGLRSCPLQRTNKLIFNVE